MSYEDIWGGPGGGHFSNFRPFHDDLKYGVKRLTIACTPAYFVPIARR